MSTGIFANFIFVLPSTECVSVCVCVCEGVSLCLREHDSTCRSRKFAAAISAAAENGASAKIAAVFCMK